MSATKAYQGKMLARLDKYGSTTPATGQVSVHGVIDRNSLEIGHGSKDFKAVQLMNEGHIYAHEPEGMTEISFTMYTRHTDYVDGSPEKIFFPSDETVTDGNATDLEPSHLIDDRVMCRFVVLFTNNATLTNAGGTIGTVATEDSKRYIFADCYITNMSSSRQDSLWRTNVTLKLAP